MNVFVVFFGVLALVAGDRRESTEVGKCTGHSGELPISTYLKGCITPPCPVEKGTDAVMNLVFKTPRPVASMTTLTAAHFPGMLAIPYHLGEKAVTCNYLTNTTCPIPEDEVVEYTLKMYINPIFPSITVDVECAIVDENDKPVTCFRVPISIVRSSTQTFYPGIDAILDGLGYLTDYLLTFTS